MRTRAYRFQPVQELKQETDFQYRWDIVMHFITSDNILTYRVPKGGQWWMKIRSIMNILAQHDSTYEVEGLDPATCTDGETMG